MLQIIRKISSGIITTILAIMMIVTIVAVIANQATEGKWNVFGYQIKTVLSGSMEPAFQTGSIIVIESKEDRTQFQNGDIITFYNSNGVIISHRVKKVINNGAQYITKGDNNNGADLEPVLAENIIGQYTGITVPYVGYVISFATSKEGAFLLMIVPGALLLCYSFIIIRRVFREIENMNGKNPEVSNNR